MKYHAIYILGCDSYRVKWTKATWTRALAVLLGDTLPSRTRRIDPSQFMLHHGGGGSQSQLQRSAAGSQPQLTSPSRPQPVPAQSANVNNRHNIELWVEISWNYTEIFTSNDRFVIVVKVIQRLTEELGFLLHILSVYYILYIWLNYYIDMLWQKFWCSECKL